MKRGWAMVAIVAIVAAALGAGILTLPRAGAAQGGPGQEPPDMAITPQQRTEVIDGALKALNEAYVFPETAKKMEAAIRERVRRGEYDRITSAQTLASVLTEHLREVCRDKHLRVRYVAVPRPARPAESAPSADERENFRRMAAARNFGFVRSERLDGNVGYLRLDHFAPAELAGETAAAAMGFLADTDALIIDLRSNGGGDPAMVALLCSYFFEGEPVHLNDIYSRPDDTTRQYWTLSYLPGRRYGKKPVYVLTSSRTFSGAEEFTYNLKNLKRATIVGETTGGGAHPVTGRRLGDHFVIGVPFARAINPITKTNWEGTGVTPDVAAPAAEALSTAHLAALKELQAKQSDPQLAAEIRRAIEAVEKERKAPAAAAAAR